MLYRLFETVLDHLQLVDEEVKVFSRRFVRVLEYSTREVHIVLFDLYLELVCWSLKVVPYVCHH